MVDERLLEILACPVCKGDLRYEAQKDILICEKCKVYYEVKEDIPILLPDSGKPLSEENS